LRLGLGLRLSLHRNGRRLPLRLHLRL
jgi:hypothetical protein